MGLIKNIKRKIQQKKTPFFLEQNLEQLLDKAILKSEILPEHFSNYREKDLYYYLFENVFYDNQVILKIQEKYIQYVPKNLNHSFLDIGCGRGEFLTLLKENNIKAKGIEINNLEAELLSKKGFEVYNKDAVSFLKDSKELYCGISAIQVVEHLSFDYLYEFIHLAYLRLITGGVLILETLNPLSGDNLKNFHTDLTHIRPVPTNSLRFLCEYAGFKDVKLCYSLPNREGDYTNYSIICYKS